MADGAALVLAGYRAAGHLVRPLMPLVIARRVARGREEPARIGERYGRASAQRPPGPLAWVHAVSVGETIAVLPLVDRLVADGRPVVLTTTTTTAAAIARGRLPDGAVHQFAPFDIGPFVRRFLRHWQPSVALRVESELWPATLRLVARSGAPLVIVNGRLSPRTYRRWRRVPALARALLSRIDLCLAQSEADGERFAALGAAPVTVTGNLKFDTPPLPVDEGALAAFRADTEGRQVWLAASTHEGEEGLVAGVHQRLTSRFAGLLTVIAPRHPGRGAAIGEMLRRRGLTVAQRGRGEAIAGDTDVYLADTMGELGLFYSGALAAFLGGSLIEHGGQNPLEPAKIGLPVLHGPNVDNFADIYRALDACGAASTVADDDELAEAVAGLISSPDRRAAAAVAAETMLREHAGALDATMAAIADFGALEDARGA